MNPATLWMTGAVVLSVGVLGLSARGDLLGRLIAVEVAVSGALLAGLGAMAAAGRPAGGTLVLLAIAVTVAEAALGLALWLAGRRLGAAADPERDRRLARREEAP
jgi:NADH:ubiquinone oxidoreductase subunit K